VKRQILILLTLIAALAPLVLAGGQASAKPEASRRTLKVKLNYTGVGVVDDKHRIYVILADANPYTSSTLIDATSQPTPPAAQAGVAHMFARQDAAGKDKTVVFRELSVSPVYVVAFFDKDGTSNGNLESASHVPMGAFGTLPDKLEPVKIEPGKTVQVVLAFDDSKTTP
jgi:hypothetical protein